MKLRVLPLLSLLLGLAGCTTPVDRPDAAVRERGEAARLRYWQIQAENAQPRKP